MRQRIFHIGLLVVMLIAGTGAFAVTWTWKTGQRDTLSCTRQWLGLSRNQCQQIRNEDPGFTEESQALSQVLLMHRQAIAERIADPTSDADSIRTTAQKVLDAHHDLMRRVVRHLLVVRRHTDPGQCMRLTSLCSGAFNAGENQAGQGNQRRGQGMGQGNQRRGQGMGQGNRYRGQGMGRGAQHRYGQLASTLSLTDVQQQAADQKDPSFETDTQKLVQQIHDAHAKLAEALQDTAASENQVAQVLEKVIGLQTQLEQRTVEYILSIRDLLSTAQQQYLMRLSQGQGQ
jgi:hypothetical protein